MMICYIERKSYLLKRRLDKNKIVNNLITDILVDKIKETHFVNINWIRKYHTITIRKTLQTIGFIES